MTPPTAGRPLKFQYCTCVSAPRCTIRVYAPQKRECFLRKFTPFRVTRFDKFSRRLIHRQSIGDELMKLRKVNSSNKRSDL